MEDYHQIALRNSERAKQIIEEVGIRRAWETIGATVNLVGSLRMGLMMKHKDIDFHIYTPTLDIAESYRAMSLIASHPAIVSTCCNNLADTDEHCLEWHANYRDKDGSIWQLDLIHILQGTHYDGYFEHMADRISELLTEETKDTVLRLKWETPEQEKIMGVEYYHAVIGHGIRTYPEFVQWRKAHPAEGIVEWIP